MLIHWVTVAYLGTMVAYIVYVASNFAGDGDISSQKEAANAQLHFMLLAINTMQIKQASGVDTPKVCKLALVYCYTVNLCAP